MGDRRSDRTSLVLRAVLPALVALGVAASAPAQTKDITIEGMRSEKRVALVIGNAKYSVGPLNNPALDARAVAQTLRGLGFEVLAHENLSYQGMRRAAADFGERVAGGGVGLFYYSGHGLQVNGRNYLVPVDADLKSERYVSAETVDVDSVLAQMQEAKTRVNIVVLDACRNNPFAQKFRGLTRGLAFMDAPAGTYVAYATAPGSVAEDGEPGKNGVYTAELVQVLRQPGLRIEDVFKRVRAGVQARTRQRQNPWDASSLTGDFYFNLKTASLTPTPLAPPAESSPTISIVRDFGSLAIRGKLPGIEVWLGDRKLGETQSGAALVVSNIAAGSHRLVARKAGHKEWERDIDVVANQRAEVVIDIEVLGPAKTLRSEDGSEMVLVPAGEFVMGSEDYDSEKPRHRVYLDAFYIDKFEVTNALYRRCVQSSTCKEPEWNEPGSKYNVRTGVDEHYRRLGEALTGTGYPVVGVSWNDADAYCKSAGKRLPTEAEWEKAARGTDGRKYPWSEQWDASRANSSESKLGRTAPVGSYASGVSPYGAHDMAGNVWEWVADWYDKDYYKRSPERNPQGPDFGTSRVLRGGSWDDFPISLRTASRYDHGSPDNRYNGIGFRCARGFQ